MVEVRQVLIGGHRIGLMGIDEIFDAVRALAIEDEARLRQVLFEKVKERNYIPPALADLYQEDLLDEYRVAVGLQAERGPSKHALKIRVYGAGCSRCEEMDRLTMSYIARHGLDVDYDYIKDPREFARQGIIGTPALTVNDKIIIIGKVPREAELERILNRALDQTTRPVKG